MSVLRIRQCGADTSIQDAGRTGYLRLGVSESGPMDWVGHAFLNRLLGNPPGAAALEFGPGGLKVEVEGQPVSVAIGAPDLRATLDGETIRANCRLTLQPGQKLDLALGRQAVWGYLAVAGGIDVPAMLRSRATNRRTGLGPCPDLAGAGLEVADAGTPEPPRLFRPPLAMPATAPLRLIPGPQDDMFAADQLQALVTRDWRVSARIDRMGYRLEGERLSHARGSDIVSDGIVLGAIQVPGDGLPTILMADRQPTGGYPKIATIIRADLPRLAQSPPGTRIGFAWTTIEAAVAGLRECWRRIDNPVAFGSPTLTSEHLLMHNLIDGVVARTPED